MGSRNALGSVRTEAEKTNHSHRRLLRPRRQRPWNTVSPMNSRRLTGFIPLVGNHRRENLIRPLSESYPQDVRPHVRFGSKADIGLSPIDVRYSPKSGHGRVLAECPLCAKSGHQPHSINSSASDRNDAGTVNPSALAMVRLMTNSNLVSRSIGRSAGLAPLRIRPT